MTSPTSLAMRAGMVALSGAAAGFVFQEQIQAVNEGGNLCPGQIGVHPAFIGSAGVLDDTYIGLIQVFGSLKAFD